MVATVVTAAATTAAAETVVSAAARGGGVGGARPPNQTAYFVALGGILVLLALLCCYFFYFCISRVKELTKNPEWQTQPAASALPPPPPPASARSYPVQTVVRDSATAMAKLCKQLPAPPAAAAPPAPGKGDTVFPTSSSPEAQRTDTGSAPPPDKVPAPAAPIATTITITPAAT